MNIVNRFIVATYEEGRRVFNEKIDELADVWARIIQEPAINEFHRMAMTEIILTLTPQLNEVINERVTDIESTIAHIRTNRRVCNELDMAINTFQAILRHYPNRRAAE